MLQAALAARMSLGIQARADIMKRKVKSIAAVAVVVGALGFGCMTPAMAADACNVRLALTLTPDVPNPQDAGFLGAMLSNSTGYQLTWISGSDTQATVQLTGPGTSAQCDEAVSKLSKDAHVLNVKVLEAGEST
jgi:hypothetical protein